MAWKIIIEISQTGRFMIDVDGDSEEEKNAGQRLAAEQLMAPLKALHEAVKVARSQVWWPQLFAVRKGRAAI